MEEGIIDGDDTDETTSDLAENNIDFDTTIESTSEHDQISIGGDDTDDITSDLVTNNIDFDTIDDTTSELDQTSIDGEDEDDITSDLAQNNIDFDTIDDTTSELDQTSIDGDDTVDITSDLVTNNIDFDTIDDTTSELDQISIDGGDTDDSTTDLSQNRYFKLLKDNAESTVNLITQFGGDFPSRESRTDSYVYSNTKFPDDINEDINEWAFYESTTALENHDTPEDIDDLVEDDDEEQWYEFGIDVVFDSEDIETESRSFNININDPDDEDEEEEDSGDDDFSEEDASFELDDSEIVDLYSELDSYKLDSIGISAIDSPTTDIFLSAEISRSRVDNTDLISGLPDKRIADGGSDTVKKSALNSLVELFLQCKDSTVKKYNSPLGNARDISLSPFNSRNYLKTLINSKGTIAIKSPIDTDIDNEIINELIGISSDFSTTDFDWSDHDNEEDSEFNLDPDEDDVENYEDGTTYDDYVNFVGKTLLHSEETESDESITNSIIISSYLIDSHENTDKSKILEGVIAESLSGFNSTRNIESINTTLLTKVIASTKNFKKQQDISDYSDNKINKFKKGWQYVTNRWDAFDKTIIDHSKVQASVAPIQSRTSSQVFENKFLIEQPPIIENYISTLYDLTNLPRLSTTEKLVIENVDKMLNAVYSAVKLGVNDIVGVSSSLYYGQNNNQERWSLRPVDNLNTVRSYFSTSYFEKYGISKNINNVNNALLSYITNAYSGKFNNNSKYETVTTNRPSEISEDSVNVNIKIKELLEKSKYFKQFSMYSDLFDGLDRAVTRVREKRLHNRELRRWYSKYGRTRQLWSTKPELMKNDTPRLSPGSFTDSSIALYRTKLQENHLEKLNNTIYTMSIYSISEIINNLKIDTPVTSITLANNYSDYCDTIQPRSGMSRLTTSVFDKTASFYLNNDNTLSDSTIRHLNSKVNDSDLLSELADKSEDVETIIDNLVEDDLDDISDY